MIPEMEGRSLLVADLVGTIALLVATLLAAVSDAGAVQILGLVVAAVLFLGGTAAWTVGFLRACGPQPHRAGWTWRRCST